MAGVRIVNTAEIIENARLKAAEMGRLNNSIRRGAGNFDGFVGENAVKHFLHIPLTLDQNTYDYDLIWQGMLIDVKSKWTSKPPLGHHDGSVSDYSREKQRCTHYVFTRVYYPCGTRTGVPTLTYIMGFMEKREYFAKARFLQVGELNGSNRHKPDMACWNLPYSQLHPITFMVRKRTG